MAELTLPEAFAILRKADEAVDSAAITPGMLVDLELMVTAPADAGMGRLPDVISILPWLATFGDARTVVAAHRVAWEAAHATGIRVASIDALYRRMALGEVAGVCVPAMNMRAIAFGVARGVFQAMRELDVGAAIFELSRGEIGFTGQRPHEYATNILCAAIAEGHTGPLFLQGDHFQISATRFAADPVREVGAVKSLIEEAVSAGFFNIDIDASTLVDLSFDRIADQQRPNFQLTAELADFTRNLEPADVTISLGGEIGEVGEHNSTVAEVRAFLDGYRSACARDRHGLTKLSVQTGTRHGGNVLQDGSFGDMPVEFDLIGKLADACRAPYGLAGPVQHGASMLSLAKMARLAPSGCIEVHLAAAFLNAVYANLPEHTVVEADTWVKQAHSAEWKPEWSEAQFLHHARRYPIGPFKHAWWNELSSHDAIRESIREIASNYFKALNVTGTRSLVQETITHVDVAWQPPAMADAAADESTIADLAS